MTGNLTAALALTVRYLSESERFERHLASFQALQHRLAEAHVTVEGVRWLGRVAAYRDDRAEEAAAAAAYAVQAARQIGADLHQLTGAIGVEGNRFPALTRSLSCSGLHRESPLDVSAEAFPGKSSSGRMFRSDRGTGRRRRPQSSESIPRDMYLAS